MKRRTPMFAAVLTAGTMLALANSAWAAPQGGVKVNQELCSPSPFGIVCFDYNYMRHEHTTPSGNTIYTTNGSNTIVQTITSGGNAGCTFTGGGDFHTHYLLRETDSGTLVQQIGSQEDLSFTRECPGRPTTTCRTILHVQRVDHTVDEYNLPVQPPRDHLPPR